MWRKHLPFALCKAQLHTFTPDSFSSLLATATGCVPSQGRGGVGSPSAPSSVSVLLLPSRRAPGALPRAAGTVPLPNHQLTQGYRTQCSQQPGLATVPAAGSGLLEVVALPINNKPFKISQK